MRAKNSSAVDKYADRIDELPFGDRSVSLLLRLTYRRYATVPSISQWCGSWGALFAISLDAI